MAGNGRQEKIESLWAQGRDAAFQGVDNIPIRYRTFTRPDQRGAIAISSGRTECMLKYREVINDLYQEGYSVYILDHRGQGFSGRMLPDLQIGHVAKFEDYVKDFKTFVATVIAPSQEAVRAAGGGGPLFLLAHSMGGCIASLYLEDEGNRGDFDAAVLCSPMHEPSTGFIPPNLTQTAADIKGIAGREDHYALGKGPYQDVAFDAIKDKARDALTHSKERYEEIRTLYNANHDIKVGGPSFQWVSQAITAGWIARQGADRIEIPVLLLQAGADEIVTPQGQKAFQERAGDRCNLVTIPGAYHELLVESDEYRGHALDLIRDFFDRLRVASPPPQ
jgi:lysophospholipase